MSLDAPGWLGTHRPNCVHVKQPRGSQAPVGLLTPLLALQPLGEPLYPSLKGCCRLLGLLLAELCVGHLFSLF